MEKQKRTIRYEPEVYQMLLDESEATGVSINEIVNRIIKAHYQTDHKLEERVTALEQRMAVIEGKLKDET